MSHEDVFFGDGSANKSADQWITGPPDATPAVSPFRRNRFMPVRKAPPPLKTGFVPTPADLVWDDDAWRPVGLSALAPVTPSGATPRNFGDISGKYSAWESSPVHASSVTPAPELVSPEEFSPMDISGGLQIPQLPSRRNKPALVRHQTSDEGVENLPGFISSSAAPTAFQQHRETTNPLFEMEAVKGEYSLAQPYVGGDVSGSEASSDDDDTARR